MAKRDIDIRVRAHDQATGVFGKVGRSLKQFSDRAQGILRKLGPLGTALTVGGLVVAGKQLVSMAAEQEKAERKLAAIMRSTGKAAGFNADELKEYARTLSRVTQFSDESIVSAEALVATFTQIKGPIFKDTVKATLDVSAAMGTDLKSSVLQLGKALNDPIRGVSALAEVGVSFNQVQRDQIRELVEQNRLMDAQRIILDELNVEFGGVAEEQAKGLGEIEQLWNALGDTAEIIGKKMVTALTDTGKETDGLLTMFRKDIEGANELIESMEKIERLLRQVDKTPEEQALATIAQIKATPTVAGRKAILAGLTSEQRADVEKELNPSYLSKLGSAIAKQFKAEYGPENVAMRQTQAALAVLNKTNAIEQAKITGQAGLAGTLSGAEGDIAKALTFGGTAAQRREERLKAEVGAAQVKAEAAVAKEQQLQEKVRADEQIKRAASAPQLAELISGRFLTGLTASAKQPRDQFKPIVDVGKKQVSELTLIKTGINALVQRAGTNMLLGGIF